MSHPLPRIYLDNAATSWPKPATVAAAVANYQQTLGGAVGRGATRRGAELQGVVNRCRARAARLLGAESPDRVIFTFNGTDSLNLALHGLLRPGDHVVTTDLEHNSVLRPLRDIAGRAGIELTHVPPDERLRTEPARVQAALRPNTRLVAVTHASNVTGTVQPIADIAAVAHAGGARVLIDAAQTAGHLPLDVRSLALDLVACSGHKGLLGPLGTGLLYIRPGLEHELDSLRQGGTGSRSEEEQQPPLLPDKYESGNHNAPGLAGLEASLGWLESQDSTALADQACRLTAQLIEGLLAVNGVSVYGPDSAADRIGVVSFNIAGFDPQIVAGILDDSFGIEVRAGLHCAPRMHQLLGTAPLGGTVRMSLGPFNTADDVAAALQAVATIAVAPS